MIVIDARTTPDSQLERADLSNISDNGTPGNAAVENFARGERIRISYQFNGTPEESQLLLSEVTLPEDQTIAAIWLVNGDSEVDHPIRTVSVSQNLLLTTLKRASKLSELELLTGADMPVVAEHNLTIHPETLSSGQVLLFGSTGNAYDEVRRFVLGLSSPADMLEINLAFPKRVPERVEPVTSVPTGTTIITSPPTEMLIKSPSQAASSIAALLIQELSTENDEIATLLGLVEELSSALSPSAKQLKPKSPTEILEQVGSYLETHKLTRATTSFAAKRTDLLTAVETIHAELAIPA